MTRKSSIPQKKNLLRIGQLAQKAGVSAPTIKHYVKEGLLPRPVKTSRNMAYYDESCVARINLIKRIQKEKFLPLDVIKRLIESGESYEEELELGRAILKSNRGPLPQKLVKGSKVEQTSEYPLEKITLLEKNGLIFPTVKNNQKYYDEADLEIIDVMKCREELGLPFHHSLETVRIYRDSINRAVNKDISLFINNVLGDVSTRQAIKFLTEADDELDRFVVLFRNRKLRAASEKAISEMNALPGKLGILNIFPTEGRELPASPPDSDISQFVFYLCRADYETAAELANTDVPVPGFAAYPILSALLKADYADALQKAEKLIPKPSTRTLDNTIAALAYLASIANAKGLSAPIYHTKKVIDHLKRIEADGEEKDPLVSLFSQYVCGAVCTLLPDVAQTRPAGIKLLEKLNTQISSRQTPTGGLPGWLIRTLDLEIFPALQVRINRLLADGYLRQSDHDKALVCLNRVIEIADPESEHVSWSHMVRLGIEK